MSGPKYSRAVIETARMLLIIQHIDSEIEEIMCCEYQRQIQRELAKTKRLRSNINDNEVESIIKKCESVIPENQLLLDFKTVFDEIHRKQENKSFGTNSKAMISFLRQLEKENIALQESVEYINNNIGELEFLLKKASIKSELVSDRNSEKWKEFDKTRNDTDLNEVAFENKCYSNNKHSFVTSNSRIQSLYEEVLLLAEQSEDSETQKRVLKSIIENNRTDEQFKIKQLKRRKELYSLDSQNTCRELDAEIRSLRKLLNIEETVLPQGEQEKRDECKCLRRQVEERASDDYINNSINEVLEECGYSIIRNDVVKTPTRSINRGIHDFSNHSVIQAAVSSNGAVMLEVMGKKENLSDSDKELIVKDMERFCPDYNVIKERLRKRGIILTNEQLYPADEQYVRSVPNNYEMKQSRRGLRKKEQLYSDD